MLCHYSSVPSPDSLCSQLQNTERRPELRFDVVYLKQAASKVLLSFFPVLAVSSLVL